MSVKHATELPRSHFVPDTRTKEQALDEESRKVSAIALHALRMNPLPILVLFSEVLKLLWQGQLEERKARMAERQSQLQHVDNLVENYKTQGTWMLGTHIGAGVLGILGGITPIIGHMKGEWLLDKLSGFFTSLQGFTRKEFVESAENTFKSMSDALRSMGQTQNMFGESARARDQNRMEMRKVDSDENTRTMEEQKEYWRNTVQFILHHLQMEDEAVKHLYR